MNQRLAAIEKQLPTFNTGKPCKRGHHSDRYTSNGSCIDCTKMAANSTTNLHKIAKAKTVLALAAGLRPHQVLISGTHAHLLDKVCDILQFSNPFAVTDLISAIERLHIACPLPRALTRDDLIKFIEVDERGNIPEAFIPRMSYENDDQTGVLYLVHNGYRYLGTEVMEVLRRQRLNVAHSGRSQQLTIS